MTIFGRTFDGQEIAALVFMLAALALWSAGLRGQMGYTRWFRRWEAERKARKDAEDARNAPPPEAPKGPWG